MAFWNTIIPEKYGAEDLPRAATFVSNAKNKGLIVKLESPEEEILPDGSRRRKEGTGYEIRFTNGLFSTRNKATLKRMLEHKAFNRAVAGYVVNHQDPSGFWRKLGVIKEKKVVTYVAKPKYLVDPNINFDDEATMKKLEVSLDKDNKAKTDAPLVAVQ
jgi:hypothetical protein